MQNKYNKIKNFENGDIFYLFTVFKISGKHLNEGHSRSKIFIKIIDEFEDEYYLQMINTNLEKMKVNTPAYMHEYFYTINKDEHNKKVTIGKRLLLRF